MALIKRVMQPGGPPEVAPYATTPRGYPFPLRSWPPDVAIDIQNLATAIDTDLNTLPTCEVAVGTTGNLAPNTNVEVPLVGPPAVNRGFTFDGSNRPITPYQGFWLAVGVVACNTGAESYVNLCMFLDAAYAGMPGPVFYHRSSASQGNSWSPILLAAAGAKISLGIRSTGAATAITGGWMTVHLLSRKV